MNSTATQTPKETKITLATVKAFARRRAGELRVKNVSSFDGMTDCVEQTAGAAFKRYDQAPDFSQSNTWGFAGAWFVNGGRDRFQPFQSAELVGFEISNSCGSFVIAAPRIDCVPAEELAAPVAKQAGTIEEIQSLHTELAKIALDGMPVALLKETIAFYNRTKDSLKDECRQPVYERAIDVAVELQHRIGANAWSDSVTPAGQAARVSGAEADFAVAMLDFETEA